MFIILQMCSNCASLGSFTGWHTFTGDRVLLLGGGESLLLRGLGLLLLRLSLSLSLGGLGSLPLRDGEDLQEQDS